MYMNLIQNLFIYICFGNILAQIGNTTLSNDSFQTFPFDNKRYCLASFVTLETNLLKEVPSYENFLRTNNIVQKLAGIEVNRSKIIFILSEAYKDYWKTLIENGSPSTLITIPNKMRDFLDILVPIILQDAREVSKKSKLSRLKKVL